MYVVPKDSDLAALWPDVKSALDAGERFINFEPGHYTAGRVDRFGCWPLFGYDDLVIDARGAVIEQVADDAQDYAVFHLEDCARPLLDGYGAQLHGERRGTNEQTHGIMVKECQQPKIFGFGFYTQRGDGIKMVGYAPESSGGVIRDTLYRDTGRSGITLHSGYRGLLIDGLDAEGVSDQVIDCESLLADSVTIRGARIRVTGPKSKIAISVEDSVGLLLEDVRIDNGRIHGVRVKDLTLRDCRVFAGPDSGVERHKAVNLYFSIDGCLVEGGYYESGNIALKFELRYQDPAYVLRRVRCHGVEASARLAFASGMGGESISFDDCHAITPTTERGEHGFVAAGNSANRYGSVSITNCSARGYEQGGLVSKADRANVVDFYAPGCDVGMVVKP